MTSAQIEIDEGAAANRQSPVEDRSSEGANRQFDVARLMLILTLAAAPWAFGAVEPWGWTALGLAACLILFLWARGCAQQGTLTLAWSPIYLPLGLFFLLGVVQYAAGFTLDRAETRQALVLLGTDLVFFFLAVQLFSTASAATWRVFGLTVLVLAAALGLFAMLQFAAGEQRIYGEVDTPGNLLFGPYVNPNHFAGLMEMLIPVAIFYIAARPGKTSLAVLLWLAVGAAIAVASLLLSGSRGGLLALAAEVVIALGIVGRPWSRPESRVPSREPRFPSPATRIPRLNLAAALATAVLGTVLLFTWIDPGVVAQKLGLIVKIGGPAWTEWAGFRKTVASDSLHMLRDHPLAGVGLGDFETAYPRYQSFPSDDWIDYAHNDYVQALAETGIPGGVLMLVALAMFLYLAFRNRDSGLGTRDSQPFRDPGFGVRFSGPLPDEDDRTPNPEPRTPNSESRASHFLRLGAALGCCGMLVHSFFDFNLHIPANAAWFAMLAGMAISGS
jgi:O-antigen ligase